MKCKLLMVCCMSLVATGRTAKAEITVLPPGPIDYSDYQAEEMVELTEKLMQHHRHSEAVDAGFEALGRGLTANQDAWVRYKMAQSYEFVNDGGTLSRKKYGEVLALHPGYERNIEIALRLGELHDHIILPGTEPNYVLAMEYYKYVVDNYDDPNKNTVALEAMQARMYLGDLYSHLRQHEKSNECYERVYQCAPEQAVPLAYKTFDSPADLQSHKVWLSGRIAELRNVVKPKLVRNCFRSYFDTTVVELENLIEKYASDADIVTMANNRLRQLWDSVAGVTTTIDEMAQNPADPND